MVDRGDIEGERVWQRDQAGDRGAAGAAFEAAELSGSAVMSEPDVETVMEAVGADLS